MDKRNNIKIVIRVIIVVALIFQLTRLDHFFVGNFSSDNQRLDLNLLKTPKLTEHFASDDHFAIYYSASDEISMVLKVFFEQLLKDTKKSAQFYDLAETSVLDYSKKQMIFLVEDFNQIRDIEGLSEYILGGGRVLFAQTPIENTSFYGIYRQLGILEAGPPRFMKGVKVEEGLFPGFPGAMLETEEFINYSLPVTLETDCAVYLTSKEGNPLLWVYQSGKGRVVVSNGTLIHDKVSSGLIVRSIALMQDTYLYPIINSKVTFLDDYPAPFPGGTNAAISEEYNKSIKDFYMDVWWTDMLELANRYGIKYTAAMIQSYNNQTNPPFEENNGDIDSNLLVALGKEILRSGGELGIHGYNHQSLTMDKWRSDEMDYKYWNSIEDMKASLKTIKEKFETAFPNYQLNVYVPPSNILTEEGLKAIKASLPTTKIISSVFYEDYQKLSYSQNFEVDDEGFIHFPRFSAGYDNNDFNKWAIMNGIASYGVFSHFIHPDDFMDPERNKGKNWEGMFEEFEEIVSELDEHYPWLIGQTATEGASSLVRYLALDYTTDYGSKGITIKTNNAVYPVYMIFQSEKAPKTTKNCQISKIDDHNYMVTIEGQDAYIEMIGD